MINIYLYFLYCHHYNHCFYWRWPSFHGLVIRFGLIDHELMSWSAEWFRKSPRIAESSVLPGLLEAAATPCWRSLSSLWEKNDGKHTCREEKVDRPRRQKIVATVFFKKRTEPDPRRLRTGEGGRNLPPSLWIAPLIRTATFHEKETFVLLFELRYPTSLKGFGACFKKLLRLLVVCKLSLVYISIY